MTNERVLIKALRAAIRDDFWQQMRGSSAWRLASSGMTWRP